MGKSNKQKRESLKAKHAARNANTLAKQERLDLLAGLKNGTIIAVDKSKICSTSAIPTIPDYYRDSWFTCKDCGERELWTAKQQQRWYEQQGGEIEAVAIRCRACRQKEKRRREAARKVHLEGLSRKRNKPD